MAEESKRKLTVTVNPTGAPELTKRVRARVEVKFTQREVPLRVKYTDESRVDFTDLEVGTHDVTVWLGNRSYTRPINIRGDREAPAETFDIDTGIYFCPTMMRRQYARPVECTEPDAGDWVIMRAEYWADFGEATMVITGEALDDQGSPTSKIVPAVGHGIGENQAARQSRMRFQQAVAFTRAGQQDVTAEFEFPPREHDEPGKHTWLRVTRRVTVRDPADKERTVDGHISVSLSRAAGELTTDLPLWVVIRNSTQALSYENYQNFMDQVFCGPPPANTKSEIPRSDFNAARVGDFKKLRSRRYLPYNDSEAYRTLKIATEAFVMVNCGVRLDKFRFFPEDFEYVQNKIGVTPHLRRFWDAYLVDINGTTDLTLPYLGIVREKLGGSRIKPQLHLAEDLPPSEYEECWGILSEKLTSPCLIELIWNYWHEEGMLVQTINAITRRFQNVRVTTHGPDPLVNFEIDPLRPLANLLFAYSRDEIHRLSLARRNYEYNHEYGLRLEGKAVPDLRPADSRSKFLEAFHQLLHEAAEFHKRDDNTTIIADGFPVLNALKEVHLILAEGAHNQFGDLPSTSRIEMLMEQWLLARPELEAFLPTRAMVAYPEPWMDRVDAMKRLQGWTDTNVLNFHNLGVFGEQLLLSIRYGNWASVYDAAHGANWARFWRPEVQGYIHAYRAVAGVDLSTVSGDARVNAVLPSVLLRRRLADQSHKQRTS